MNIFCCISSLCAGLLQWTTHISRLFNFCYNNRLRHRILLILMLVQVASALDNLHSTEENVTDAEINPLRFTINSAEYQQVSKKCQERYANFSKEENETYCDATFDQFLCWPPTKAGTNVTQNCPEHIDLVDPNGEATRYCGPGGRWLDADLKNIATGWTNYIRCFPVRVQDLLAVVTTSDPNAKFAVAGWVRAIEFLGVSCSAVGLVSGIAIFIKFKSLMNKRTKIHMHLFTILLCQCLLTLTIYIDQEHENLILKRGIGCKLGYIFLEYLQTNSFFFMLLEGFNLYRTVRDNVMLLQISYHKLITFAYMCPVINNVAWVIVATIQYEHNGSNWCWFGYNLDTIYWILQGPRLAIIITNLFFMGGVIHILIAKLTDNNQSDIERIKKACRATILLMPLLGITNFLSLTSPPLKGATISFATWALVAYIFKSFQGFIIVYLYCFTNAEVQEVLRHYFDARRRRKQPNLAVRFRAHTSEPECEVLSREVESRRVSQQPETPTLVEQHTEPYAVEIHMKDSEGKADNGKLKSPTHEDSEIRATNGQLKSPIQKDSETPLDIDNFKSVIHEEDCKIVVENKSTQSPMQKKECKILLDAGDFTSFSSEDSEESIAMIT